MLATNRIVRRRHITLVGGTGKDHTNFINTIYPYLKGKLTRMEVVRTEKKKVERRVLEGQAEKMKMVETKMLEGKAEKLDKPCWCDHSKTRMEEKRMLRELNREHIQILMQKNSRIEHLNREVSRRKLEIMKIKEEIESSLQERSKTITSIQDKLSERFGEREKEYRERISQLQGQLEEQSQELRRIHSLEHQLRGLEEEREKERRERRAMEESLTREQAENLLLQQRALVQEELMKERETKKEEVFTAIIEEIHGRSEFEPAPEPDLELESLLELVRESSLQENGSTPFCNEKLRILLEDLLSKGEEFRRLKEGEFWLEYKASKEENERMRAEVAELRRRLAEAVRETEETRQRMLDEKAVTERIEYERRELLQSLAQCDHATVDLKEDLAVYKRALKYESSKSNNRAGSRRSSSSSSSESESQGKTGTIRIDRSSLPPRPTRSMSQVGSTSSSALGLQGMGTTLSSRKRDIIRTETQQRSFQSSSTRSSISSQKQ